MIAQAGSPPKAPAGRLWTIPNVLSALRLPLAAAFVIIRAEWARAVLLSLGALTDALDGWIARRRGEATGTGALLDPLFDKVFVLVALATFLADGRLGVGSFLVLVVRDLYNGAAYFGCRLAGLRIPVQSRFSGKVVTVLQVGTLFLLLFRPAFVPAMVVLVGIASAYAIGDYTWARWRTLREPA